MFEFDEDALQRKMTTAYENGNMESKEIATEYLGMRWAQTVDREDETRHSVSVPRDSLLHLLVCVRAQSNPLSL